MNIEKRIISKPTRFATPTGASRIIDALPSAKTAVWLARNERNQEIIIQSCPEGQSADRAARTEYRGQAPYQLDSENMTIHLED